MLSRLLCTLCLFVLFGPWQSAQAVDLAAKFAPKLRFDRAAVGYPMSAQPFYEAMQRNRNGATFVPPENLDVTSLHSGKVPTYYQVRQFGNQVRIHYWWFYGFQHPCFLDQGQHNGDWEHIMVTLAEDKNSIAAVTYYQHNGS
ncbi:MAG: hypothetical protein HYZ45_14545, partial [Burkholderiales bacterium]|nr:hypothetical protein [Burkholderiales bacterium]